MLAIGHRLNIHRSSQIFRDALDASDAERSAFVESACAGDSALRAEVERLLALAFADTPKLVRPNLTDVTDAANGRGMAQNVGQLVGAFSLVRPIGTGGMGAVWLAERVEGFSQQVAIKWLHAGLSRTARTRFARERETLAKLEHPGIARIVDGGSDFDADWYAMEFVDGPALDQYAKANNLDLPARLKLVLQLCDAVQYAHQNLIVHRDLKPANVLVGKDGAPKLLDFGIAKSLHDNNELTASAAPMTFAYAAPEQIKNERITTATDVYALGVVVYELLTGQRPHKVKAGAGDGSLSILQAITDNDATAPSSILARESVTGSGIKASALKGDLDTIVLKALSRDPARRYASAQALADDLRRFVANEPISARPDSLRYRLSKMLRRNRVAAAGVTFAIAALLLGGVLALQQARRANAEAAISQRALANTLVQATQTDALLTHLSSVLTRAQASGATVATEQLMDWASDPKLSGEYTDPKLNLALRLAISEFLLVKNDYARTLEVLDALGPELARASDFEQLQALNNRTRALTKSGKLDAAQAALDQALTLDLPVSTQLAQLRLNQSDLLRAQGKPRESANAARSAAAVAARVRDGSALAVGALTSSAATLLLQADALDDAVALSQTALKIWHDGKLVNTPNQASAQIVAANALYLRGYVLDAVAQYRAIEADARASETTIAHAARTSGFAKALVFANSPDEAMERIRDAQTAMCKASGATSLDCMQMTLSAADTAQLAGNLDVADSLLDQVAAQFRSNPIPPLMAAMTKFRLRAILLRNPSPTNADALINGLTSPKPEGSVRRSAVRALLSSAQALYLRGGKQREAQQSAQALARAALVLGLPNESGGMDQSLLGIWRARLDGAEADPKLWQNLAQAIGPEHPWVQRNK